MMTKCMIRLATLSQTVARNKINSKEMKNCFKVIISIINTNEGRISGLEGSSIEITKVRKKKH